MRPRSLAVVVFPSLLAVACRSDRSTAPEGATSPQVTLTGSDVIRLPSEESFQETGRFYLAGIRKSGGRCRFGGTTELQSGTRRTEHFVEFKPSTCEAVVGYREEKIPAKFLLAPEFDLTPAGPPNYVINSYDSTSYSGDVTYSPPTSTVGSAYQTLGVQWPLGSGGQMETRESLVASYSKYNGCFATVHLSNIARWLRNSSFGWGLTNFNMPTLGSQSTSCGTIYVDGIAYFDGNATSQNTCWGGDFHTYYSNSVYVTAAGTGQFPYTIDINTGSCFLNPVRDYAVQ